MYFFVLLLIGLSLNIAHTIGQEFISYPCGYQFI